jgi:ribosomal protein S18 acetylase RimI-like enzyme
MPSGASALDELELQRRQAASQRHFFRIIASASRGARLFELGDVQATIVPVRPAFSFFDSVFYEDADALEQALPALASTYAGEDVTAWTVWVRPGDSRARSIVEAAGHVFDSGPTLMAAPVDAIDLDDPVELGLLEAPSWAEVARCNDRAHGVPDAWSMAAAFEQVDDRASHRYAIARDGEVVSTLVAREQDGDCYFWFVATLPEAQGQGLARGLMCHALREAARRGATTTTLESTRAGEALYTGLGYQPFGRYELWERRTA